MIVSNYTIELCCRLVHHGAPVLAPICAYLCATIISNNHTGCVFRCNPKVVMIAMWRISAFEGMATIFAAVV